MLAILFFAAVNLGSIRVGFPALLRGLFVEYNDKVDIIFDLHFLADFWTVGQYICSHGDRDLAL